MWLYQMYLFWHLNVVAVLVYPFTGSVPLHQKFGTGIRSIAVWVDVLVNHCEQIIPTNPLTVVTWS